MGNEIIENVSTNAKLRCNEYGKTLKEIFSPGFALIRNQLQMEREKC